MRKEYDFSKGKRGAVIPSPGKTRITIMLDDDVIEAFRKQAEAKGTGYQTAINEALRASIGKDEVPLTVRKLREVLRQELRASSGAADPGEKLEGAVRGAAVGAVAAPVLGASTGAAQRALGKRAAVNEVKRLAPERDDLRAAAQALYRQADNLGVVLKPQTVSSIQGQLAAAAQDLGFHPGIHPKVAVALEDFADLAKPGTTPTLARLEQQRRILGSAAKSLEPDERRIASELIDHYDDAIQGLKASDVHAGNYVQAGATLKRARALWKKQAKLGTIDEATQD